MVHYKQAHTLHELKQILDLQRDNLAAAVSSARVSLKALAERQEKEKEGYVTVRHDLDILGRMNDTCQHILAVDKKQVVGYALCMHPKFGNEIPILRPMFSEITKQNVVENFIVMGQICIKKTYRRQGIFRKLYEVMLHSIKPEFTTIITEVAITNIRSLNAHHAIGFKEISNYSSENKHWQLMILEQFRTK